MYVEGLRYTQYSKEDLRTFSVHINSAHVTISRNGEVVFDRTDGMADEWYDAKHERIVKALRELEAAFDEAIDK